GHRRRPPQRAPRRRRRRLGRWRRWRWSHRQQRAPCQLQRSLRGAVLMPAKSRSKNKDNARRAKKKTSILITEGVEYVDWKDVNLLCRFMSDRSKVRARRVTGNNAQQQADVAKAIKNAREMALLPYVTRITQQRGGRGDRSRGG